MHDICASKKRTQYSINNVMSFMFACSRPFTVLLGGALLSACSLQPGTSPEDAKAESTVDLVDPAYAAAADESWGYQQRLDADLDGDGQIEELVLAAQVESVRGRPAWDDGQVWQVYVRQADGARRVLYSRRLQLGTLTLRVTQSEGARSSLVLIEHLPDSLSVYELHYSTDDVEVVEHLQRQLDPRGDFASPRFP